MFKRYIGTLNIEVPEKISNEVQQRQRTRSLNGALACPELVL
jgi:hypothetical protein